MKPKIVILGAGGMLGHKLFQRLRERFPGTVATTRESVREGPLRGVELLQGDDVVAGLYAWGVLYLLVLFTPWALGLPL